MKTEPTHRSSSGQGREDPSGQNHLHLEVCEFRCSLQLPGEGSRSFSTRVGPIGEGSTPLPSSAPEPTGVPWRTGHTRTILDTLSHSNTTNSKKVCSPGLGKLRLRCQSHSQDTAAGLEHSASLSTMPRCLSQASRDKREHTDPGTTSFRGKLAPERVISSSRSQNRARWRRCRISSVVLVPAMHLQHQNI